MSKKISELTPLGSSISGNELIEVAAPNANSPTGYVSRRIKTSELGGSGGDLPFRFPFEYRDVSFDEDYAFGIEFNRYDFTSTGLWPNSGTEGDFAIGAMVMHFNFVGGVALPYDPYAVNDYSTILYCNSSVLINPLNSSDGDIAYVQAFSYNDAVNVYKLNDYQDISNHSYNTFMAVPYSTSYDEYSSPVIVKFKVSRPYNYNSSIMPERVSVKGYADITSVFIPNPYPNEQS
jgi:hypothetical protein